MSPVTLPLETLVTVPFSEAQAAHLRELSPRIKLTFQAARKPEEISPETWAHCEVLYTDRVLPAPDLVPALRWIQFHFAGLDASLESPLLHKEDIAVTTLSGASASQMAEYAIMMLLALGHHFPELMAAQTRADWPRDRFERFMPKELRGSTVGIVGYGSIGRQVAALLKSFGAVVLAAKRDAMHPEDTGYIVEGMGDPAGDLFDRLYPIQALQSMLKECDFVVVTVPLTPETQGLIGAAELAAMRPGAYLVDTSRGGVIDPPALLQALQEKRIAGAALDVFSEEPLPANNPLWKLPNLLLTPHISGISAHYNERALQLFSENLTRYIDGLPLLNRYDQTKGY
jgi:phosphoglycerate dehydrogenase-like enzyme